MGMQESRIFQGMKIKIAIVGGGPGGLMTAYQLQKRGTVPFEITIYEAGPRLGGKIQTKQFSLLPAAYEAGAAELYDYSAIGDDPLREMIDELGLSVRPLNGIAKFSSVLMGDHILRDLEDTRLAFGDETWLALKAFDDQARHWMSPRAYYDSDWQDHVTDPMLNKKFDTLLASVPDEKARHYLQTLLHSDLATEPHQTNAHYGLQNYLMNHPEYMSLYTIDGGIEQLPKELAARISAEIRLKEPVVRIEQAVKASLRVVSRKDAIQTAQEYDYVVVALPNNWLPAIQWGGELLQEAMHRHHVYYDYPAHYLRVTLLFKEPFWRSHLKDSYFMLDAFGGCCLYDESSRNDHDSTGVLGWLLAGEAALSLCNYSHEELIPIILDSLPSSLQHGRELFLEGRVHRWIGSVNGLPAGLPPLDMDARHLPEPKQHPHLFVVGDYLFDSTLNGVLDSADYVAEWLTAEMEEQASKASHLSIARMIEDEAAE